MIHSLPSHHDIFMRYCGFFFLVISYFSWSFLLEIYQFYSFFNKATFMFALLFCSIDFCLHLYYLFLDIYFRGIFLIDFEIIMWFFILKYFSLLTYSFEVMFSFYTLLELHSMNFDFFKLLFNFTLCIFSSLLKTYRLLRKSIAWFSSVCEFYRYYFLLNEIMVNIIHFNMCYLLKFVLLWVFPQFLQNPFSTCVAYALMNIPREIRLENRRNLSMWSPYFKNLYHYDLWSS